MSCLFFVFALVLFVLISHVSAPLLCTLVVLQDKSDESIRDRVDRGKLNEGAQQMLTELLRHVTMEKPQIRVRSTNEQHCAAISNCIRMRAAIALVSLCILSVRCSSGG